MTIDIIYLIIAKMPEQAQAFLFAEGVRFERTLLRSRNFPVNGWVQ